jgi:hypothetical protein
MLVTLGTEKEESPLLDQLIEQLKTMDKTLNEMRAYL